MDNNTENIEIQETVAEPVVETEAKKSVKKRKRRKLSYYFTGGLIAGLLGLLTDSFYRALQNGLFGKMFTSYSAVQNKFDNGFFKGRLFSRDKFNRYVRNARRVLAEGFENSFSLGFVKKVSRTLLENPVKNYGNYMLSFGIYTVFTYFVKTFLNFFEPADTVHFLSGTTFILISIPMLMSKASLAEALGSSIGARALLCDVFGTRDESFEVPSRQTTLRANLAIIIGMAAGFLTLVVDPLHIILAIALVVAIALIIVTPEIGVVISLFVLPFMSFFDMPSILLTFVVGISALGYLVKLIRGKRIIKFEILDTAVLAFLLIMLLSGAVSAGGETSLYEAYIGCALVVIYFLITNMMRTKKWVDRCVIALVSSAAVTSVLGIVEYFFGELSTKWLDTGYFSDIKGRVVSLFDNSNVLAFYLVMIFPFVLDLAFRCKNRSEKFLSSFAALSMLLCVVFTWSRGAWLGLIVATVVYLLIKTRGVVKAVFGFVLALPVLAVVLPDNVINRFMSIGDLSDSSTYYRVLTWRGSFRAIADGLLGGYGYGNSAFEVAYPRYAYAGIEAAEHSHNLFLQITFGMGLIGLIVFLIAALLFCGKTLEFFTNVDIKEEASVAAAAFAAFASAMAMGLFDYVWYNNRVMFLFFAVMGIACAVVRMGDEQKKRKEVEIVCDNSSAYIDI